MRKNLRHTKRRPNCFPSSDLAARRVMAAEQELKLWHEAANRRRQAEADKQVRQARLEAARPIRPSAVWPAKTPLWRKAASSLPEKSRRPPDNSRRQGGTRQAERAIHRHAEEGQSGGHDEHHRLAVKEEAAELLPNVTAARQNIDVLQSAIGENQLAFLGLNERRTAMANMEQQVKTTLANLDPPADPANAQELERAVREALQTEKEYLDALIGDHNKYYDELIGLMDAQQQLIAQTEACGKYIDERVLWIASAGALRSRRRSCRRRLVEPFRAGIALGRRRRVVWRRAAESAAACGGAAVLRRCSSCGEKCGGRSRALASWPKGRSATASCLPSRRSC